MSRFQRMIAYINMYEGRKKIGNVGFARVEGGNQGYRIELHLKNTGYTGVACPLYLLVGEEGGWKGLLLGDLHLKNGGTEGEFTFSQKDICGSNYHGEQVSGIFLPVTEQHACISMWKEQEFSREDFQPWKLGPEREHTPVEAGKGETEAEIQGNSMEEAVSEEFVTEEVDVESAVKEVTWNEKWRVLLEQYPVMTPFAGAEDILCLRLDLRDLRLLPKKIWGLGNNSFLLHGFFNYRYLLLGTMEEKWFLGVPGIYQNQEKQMAAMFGFPEFMSEKPAAPKTGRFGYWYCYLDLQ